MDSIFTHPPFSIGARNVTLHEKQWYHNHLNFEDVRVKVKHIKGKVWVIDDTAKVTNDTLDPAIKEIWEFTDEDGQSGMHGHHVGGIIACAIYGLFPSCQLAMAKVLSSATGTGKGTWIANAIDQASKSKYRVINASIGSDTSDSRILKAIKSFCASGGFFVAASGNDGRETDYPAAYSKDIEGVISVGALELKNGKLTVATYSSAGEVTFVFPGTFITSSFPHNEYGELSGTSMATPFVSGLIATILEIKPDLGFVQFMEIAKQYTIDVEKGTNKDGHGFIDVLGIVSHFLEKDVVVQDVEVKSKSFCSKLKNWFR